MGWLKEIYPYILVILMVVIIRTFIITPVRVNGSSMEPTLYENEILILEKYHRSFKRFDVIVIKYGSERLVKRIIGLPGEHIEYKNSMLYVNGEYIAEDFLTESTLDFDIRALKIDTVPENTYFVMGDNRNNSTDSRILGSFKESDVLGQVRLILYPFNRFGSVQKDK